ncbi:MAG TPA: TolC family protein [Blastocatellia bacterium]|nr:TolC family protein [Blastocatellia bacterium]
MKSKTRFRSIGASLLLLISAQVARPQSSGQEMGLVLSAKPPKTAQPAEAPSVYSQSIDPVNGLGADELVRYGLKHNGELAAARQAIAEARGKFRQAGLKANPMLETSGTHAANTPDNSVMVGAELPLELGGRRNARIAVAIAELKVRESEVADFERKIAADIRMKYADALAAARNLKFTEDLLNLTRDSHRLVQARVERGKSAPLEQNLLLVELNRVDALRIGFESRAEVSLFELKKVIGMPPGEPLRLRGEFDISRQQTTQGDAVRNALATRPDLLAARAAETLAAAQIDQARIDGRVDASLFASYERMRSGFDVFGFNDAGARAPVTGVFHNLTFGVKLTLPVRNKNEGNIEAAVAASEAARSRREFTELVVRNEVAAAYTRLERAQAALAVYRDGVRNQAERNLDVIRQTYTLGQKTALDYVSEQRRFVEVETGYTEVLKEYFNSLVELERAAGTPVPSA